MTSVGNIHVEIIGKPELLAKLRPESLTYIPIRDFLLASALTVEAEAKKVIAAENLRDTGTLFRSIDTKVYSAPMPNMATVGTVNPYAIFVHGDPAEPGARTRPHWPPMAAIAPWAARHGIPAFLVARAIARKGTRMVPFLTLGLTAALPMIDEQLAKAGAAIEARWSV